MDKNEQNVDEQKLKDGEQSPEDIENKEGEDKGGDDKSNEKNIVNELKELRAKSRQWKEEAEKAKELEQQLEEMKDKGSDEVLDKIKQFHEEQSREDAKKNRKRAMEQFVASHSTFNEENDPSGIKRQALEDKFARFNLDGLKEVDEFNEVITDAYKLLYPNAKVNDKQEKNPYTSSNPNVGSEPSSQKPGTKLSGAEQKLVDEGRATEEQINKIRTSNPDLLENMLDFVR